MASLDDYANAKLAELELRHLRRSRVPTTRRDGVMVERAGRSFVSFSCNDYLGLSAHPALAAAAREATEQFGFGAGASRLVTGDHPLYAALEERLARLKGTAAACVFGSGYLANIGHRAGAGRRRRPGGDRRARPCLPVGGSAAQRRDGPAVPA